MANQGSTHEQHVKEASKATRTATIVRSRHRPLKVAIMAKTAVARMSST